MNIGETLKDTNSANLSNLYKNQKLFHQYLLLMKYTQKQLIILKNNLQLLWSLPIFIHNPILGREILNPILCNEILQELDLSTFVLKQTFLYSNKHFSKKIFA